MYLQDDFNTNTSIIIALSTADGCDDGPLNGWLDGCDDTWQDDWVAVSSAD
eukprot:CAMPEP_0183743370 /NCGR_PEP_ID=MMETSP0737-20130205/65186_1 /TAXON_ID=385413 /ORGANISM="Thalassiosira miniscula, Strain CCMP1093" /LENGTH=50 /DNA_ID=CAMNT_0025978989 /DNA_START=124 /DNA_END=276 /DNA_ORIENTATION=-